MGSKLTRREEFLRALELDRSRNNASTRMNLGLLESMGTKDLMPFAKSTSSAYFSAMRELNPPLRILVNQRVSEVQWLLDHATGLTFVILADLLWEQQLTTKALEEASRLLPPEMRQIIYPKQIQRLANEYYRNVIHTVVQPSPAVKKLMSDPKLIVLGPPQPKRPI